MGIKQLCQMVRDKFLIVPFGGYRHANQESYCGNGLGLEILKGDVQININEMFTYKNTYTYVSIPRLLYIHPVSLILSV